MSKARKTKQQKLITQLKRELAQNSPKQILPVENPKKNISVEPEQKQNLLTLNLKSAQLSPKQKSSPTSVVTLPYDKSFIKKDLFKTGVIATLAMLIELVLYFTLNFRS